MEQFRPSRLWKRMSAEQRIEAARALWEDENADEQQAEAVVAIAQQLKFRPKSAATLPLERRTRYLAGLPNVSDVLASRLLVAFHLSTKRPMMGRFLDALGVAHENGLIADEELKPADPVKLAEAARTLRAEYPDTDVDLYFATLIAQDPDTWGGLQELLSAPA